MRIVAALINYTVSSLLLDRDRRATVANFAAATDSWLNCGTTAGQIIKLSLKMVAGIGQGHTVLDR